MCKDRELAQPTYLAPRPPLHEGAEFKLSAMTRDWLRADSFEQHRSDARFGRAHLEALSDTVGVDKRVSEDALESPPLVSTERVAR
jgi:hypothetical protein